MEIHHFALFGNYWCGASRDKKYLTKYVTLQKHVIEGSNNFMSESFVWYVTTLQKIWEP